MQEEIENCSLCKKALPMDSEQIWTDQEGNEIIITNSSIFYAVAKISAGEMNVCEPCAEQLPEYLTKEDKTEIYYQLGLELSNAGRNHQAIVYLMKAEKNAKVLFALGNAHREIGELETAKKYFENVLQIDPNDPYAQSNLEKLEVKERSGETASGN